MALKDAQRVRGSAPDRPVSQQERVAAMRNRLLDATVECLVEAGYHGLSTNDVVRRAGVSRGALAHHFPAKADLVTAAAQRLIKLRADEFRRTFRDLPPDRRSVAEALDLLWSFFEGPTFAALLELTVAARTDPELRTVFIDGPAQITDQTMAVFRELFPDLAGLPHVEETVAGVLALYIGLGVQTVADGDVHGRHAAVRGALISVLSHPRSGGSS